MKATRRWAPPRFKLCLRSLLSCHVQAPSHYPQRLITLPAHVHNTRVALSPVRRRGSCPCLRPVFPSNQPHAHHHCLTSHRHLTQTTVAGERQQQQQPQPSHTPPPPTTTGSNLDLGQLLRISPYPFSFSLRPLQPPAPSPRRPSSPLLSLITNKKKKPRHKEQKQEKLWDATTRTTPASPTARYD